MARHRRSTPDQRVDALIAAMTLREKLAQLYAVWVGVSPAGGDDVAPFQHELTDGVDFDAVIQNGLGQLTRPFGSAPVDPAVGVLSLARTQRRIVAGQPPWVSPRSRTRSAWPASPPGARPPTRCRSPGAPASTPS